MQRNAKANANCVIGHFQNSESILEVKYLHNLSENDFLLRIANQKNKFHYRKNYIESRTIMKVDP